MVPRQRHGGLLKRKGNISQTAKDLGISRTTLYRKLEDNHIRTGRS
ncbi:helix-turn-helix domain-containing protein [Paenibacillus darwinianus]